MNISKSVFKIRDVKQAKVIGTPEPKRQWGSEDCFSLSLRGQQYPSDDSRHLTRCYFLSRTWKPPISPASAGKSTVRKAHGSGGLGGRNKRMPSCNGVDTGHVPRCESMPTSDWSFIARDFVESSFTEESI